MNSVIVSGGFDDLRSRQVRFLKEAASLGPVGEQAQALGVRR